ncbi:MAG TPA: hypothetical protein VJS64_12900, partial [Pyrinomonadaceae bacterium]|nr:hypothetical protein [Pyrinomonadaceae bacterium]
MLRNIPFLSVFRRKRAQISADAIRSGCLLFAVTIFASSVSPGVNAATYTLVCDGNSLTAGTASDMKWPTMLATNLGSSWSITNGAVTGLTTAQMLQDSRMQLTLGWKQPAALRNFVICWEGGNSIFAGSTAAQALTEIVNYCSRVRQNGQE